MAIDPSEIELSPEEKELLARFADTHGIDWRQAFQQAFQHSKVDAGWLRAQQQTLNTFWDNEEDAAYDEL